MLYIGCNIDILSLFSMSNYAYAQQGQPSQKEASFLVFGNHGKKFTSFQNKKIFLQGMKKYYRGIMENFPFSSLENSSVLGNSPVFLLCKNTVLYAGMRRIITSNRHPSFYFGENWKDPAIQRRVKVFSLNLRWVSPPRVRG